MSFEIAMLLVAMIALGGAIAATWSVSMDDPEDLQFGAAREALEEFVREQDAIGLATVMRVRDTVAGQVVEFDTLAITGDSLRLPSLARGGFVHDEVIAFNDASLRNAWGPVLAGRTDRLDQAELPSLFQLVRDDSGRSELSEELNPYRHRVLSPGLVSAGVRVLAADWRRGPSAVGALGDLTITKNYVADEKPPVVSYGQCRMHPDSVRALSVYCGVAPGITLGRQYDLRVVTASTASFSGALRLTENRQTTLYVRGARMATPATIRAGDMIYTTRIGPVAFTESEIGRLAGPQWVNGRETYHVAARGSLRAFAGAGRHFENLPNEQGLPLTLDASLTGALDTEIAAFADSNASLIDAMSVSVVDLSTGAVLSISELGSGMERPLLAFEPVLVGSMSKPLIAAAILSRRPELAVMELPKSKEIIDEVSGILLTDSLGNPDNRCPSVITFEAYLSCSSNQYAAELLVRSLQRRAGDRALAPRGRVSDAVLMTSPLAEGLLDLYDDVVLTTDVRASRSAGLWMADARGTDSMTVPRDVSLRPYRSRPIFITADTAGVKIDDLVRFAIGGWENRWTLLGVLEGYARIVTNRRVHLTVIASASTAARGDTVRSETARAFRAVRRGLRAVATTGTASDLDAALGKIGGPNAPLTVMAKTGTLNENANRAGDAGVFLKALAITLGRPNSTADAAPMRCGLGVVVYVQFRQDWQERARLPKDSKLPDLHRRFATGPLTRSLRTFWERRDPCHQSSARKKF